MYIIHSMSPPLLVVGVGEKQFLKSKLEEGETVFAGFFCLFFSVSCKKHSTLDYQLEF